MLIKCVDYNVLSVHTDTKGQLVLLNVDVNRTELTIVNVYAPNIVYERILFFKQVSKFTLFTKMVLLLKEILIVSYQVGTESHV